MKNRVPVARGLVVIQNPICGPNRADIVMVNAESVIVGNQTVLRAEEVEGLHTN